MRMRLVKALARRYRAAEGLRCCGWRYTRIGAVGVVEALPDVYSGDGTFSSSHHGGARRYVLGAELLCARDAGREARDPTGEHAFLKCRRRGDGQWGRWDAV